MKEGEPRKRSSVAMEKQFLLSVIPGGSLSAVDYFRIGALIVALTPAVVKRTKYRKMGKKRINMKNMKFFKKN